MGKDRACEVLKLSIEMHRGLQKDNNSMQSCHLAKSLDAFDPNSITLYEWMCTIKARPSRI